jgi:Type VIII secretion system (T8SS), CsgF protein
MRKLTQALMFLLLLGVVTRSNSAPLPDFQFKSPSFNGQNYGTYVLTIENEEYTRQQAIQQALLAAQQQAATAAQNTPLNEFLANLESRILAQVSQNLATAMFAGGSATSGTFSFQGNTIFWQNTGGNIQLTITDSLGNQTTITVPLGTFNITGSGTG